MSIQHLSAQDPACPCRMADKPFTVVDWTPLANCTILWETAARNLARKKLPKREGERERPRELVKPSIDVVIGTDKQIGCAFWSRHCIVVISIQGTAVGLWHIKKEVSSQNVYCLNCKCRKALLFVFHKTPLLQRFLMYDELSVLSCKLVSAVFHHPHR